MKESKLQARTIRLVFQIYVTVFAISCVLSYFFVVRPLKSNAVENYKVQNDYILEQIDSLFKTIKDYTNYVAYSETFLDKMEAYVKEPADHIIKYDLETNLYNSKSLKREIQDIVLEIDGLPPVYSILDLKHEEQEILASPWYRKIRGSGYSGGFSKGASIIISDTNEKARVIAYSKSYQIKNRKFTLTVFFRYDDVFGNIMRYYQNEFAEQYFICLDGSALFAEEQENLERLMTAAGGRNRQVILNGGGLYLKQELKEAAYSSVAYVSNAALYEKILPSMVIILSMAIGLLVGTLFIVIYIVKRLTCPIYNMTKAMDQVITDNFNRKLPVESDDEIGYLSQTFNTMSEELKKYFRQLVEKMEAEEEMKLRLLISQIDPHFVCNTLNTVKYLAAQQRTKDVQVVAAALSNILRDRLRIKNFQIYDTLEQEIDTIRQYLTIQEYRYGGQVTVLWDVPQEEMRCRIPKNMIQPLVENALFHGLADVEDGVVKGVIQIQVQRKGKDLLIRVVDNGQGLTEEQIKEILSDKGQQAAGGHGIGISNIRERLKLLFQKNAEFHIYSVPGEETVMEIVIKSLMST